MRASQLLLLAVSVLSANATAQIEPLSGIPAPEWDALFDRTSGWTGADGIYSIPLSGSDVAPRALAPAGPSVAGPLKPASPRPLPARTLFVFSDTFIGSVDANGARVAGATLVNNTAALLDGSLPDTSAIEFQTRTDAGGAPIALVVPNGTPGAWFWPVDGIALGARLYVFALEVELTGAGGGFGFEVSGVTLLDTASTSTPDLSAARQTTTPLFIDAADGDSYFGAALMANTAAAGAPFPDGYVYVYGVRNLFLNKQLLAARVLPSDIADFSRYLFWDGAAWVPNAASAAGLTDRLSSEFSVTPLADGRCLLVFQLDTFGPHVAVRYGASPTGPWDPFIRVYACPEDTLTPNTFVYNAKAHPHLSSFGELLISYNVNSFAFAENLANADIYRPRFLRLPLGR